MSEYSKNEYRIDSGSDKISLTSDTNTLSCYTCNSIHDGDSCYNVSNSSIGFTKKCPTNQPYCKVYRVEYLLLEDFKSSDDGPYTPWSMERSCSDECKNFCVTMGGRTKLTYCTSCCTENYCNVDNSGCIDVFSKFLLLIVLAALYG